MRNIIWAIVALATVVVGRQPAVASVVAADTAVVAPAVAADTVVVAPAVAADTIVAAAVVAKPLVDPASLERLDYTATPRQYIVGTLSAEGLTMTQPELLLSITGLVTGDSIALPGDRIADATRKLWALRHFSDVKTTTAFHGDTIDVNFILTERQRVRQWSFEGVNATEKKEISEGKLRLRRSSELSPYLLSTSMEKLREYYNEKGFRNADISYRIEPDTTSNNQSHYVLVTFVVERKKKVRVGEILFEGAPNLSPKKMARAMEKTKKVSINFFADTKFKDADFTEDLRKVEAYARSQGYRDALVVADSLYPINEKRVGVWIKLHQGKKYTYRDIEWIGNSIIPTDQLSRILVLEKGDTYDSESMGHRLGTIQGKQGEPSVQALYMDDGYLAFRVEPIETVVGDSVDVQIRIVEGKQFTIRDVRFDGNTRTNDHVVRRELDTRPGDLYSQTLLVRSYQRLAQMGQFDPTSFSAPNVVPDFSNETVDIGYSLKEVSKDQFELSAGWGGGMFIASVGVNFTNVSLRKFFDKNAWRPYPAGDNQTIGLKIQSNGTYYQALSVNFVEPWLGGHKPTSLSVSFYTSRESDAYYLGATPTAYFGTIGGTVSIGKRLNWPDPYFYMSLGVSMQTYNLKNWSYFLIKNGSSNLASLSFTIGRNSIDDPYQYSSQGSDISLSLSLTPPYSLWDGKDYSKRMSENERFQWIEYHKWRFNAKWFVPLTRDNKLVLMARMQFGYLGYYNKYKPSPFEGFQVGGDGLAGYNLYGVETVGLRGYENGALTPNTGQGVYANIFSKYTLELRYPVVRSEGTLVYVLAFAEAGNAFSMLDEFKPFNLKRSAGFGARIFLPILGMLGVDWGYGFDNAPGRSSPSGSQFHFSMGMQM